jgi:hypothetical protein
MRRLMRRVLVLVCVFALVSGSTISFAAATAASTPCAHEDSDQRGAAPHHHDHHGAGCLACCLGACAAISALPDPVSTGDALFAVTVATYWEVAESLSSRSIAPDPGPPRTIG